MPLTTIETEYTGQATFPLPFSLGILSEANVFIQVNDEVDGLGDPLYWEDFTFISNDEVIINGLSVGDTVRISRKVSITDLEVDYVSGADITRSNLNRDAKQSIMLIQENRDMIVSVLNSSDNNAEAIRQINLLGLGSIDDISQAISQAVIDIHSSTVIDGVSYNRDDTRTPIQIANAQGNILTPRRSIEVLSEYADRLDDGDKFGHAGQLYIKDSQFTGEASVGVDGIIPSGHFNPEHFADVGNGEDATDAFRRGANAAKIHQTYFCGKSSQSLYRISDTIWLGLDNGAVGIRGFIGNGAIIENIGVNNAPMFDFAGVQNSLKFPITGWRILAGTNASITPEHIPTCIFFFGRPTRTNGTAPISSGNAVVTGNQMIGYWSCDAILDMSSESNTIEQNEIIGHNVVGGAVGLYGFDYFSNTTLFEMSGFTNEPDDVITGANGGEALAIRTMSQQGRVRVLLLNDIPFVDGEALTFAGGGSATLTRVRDIIGPASPNVTINNSSTSAWFIVDNNQYILTNVENNEACSFVDSFIHGSITRNNNTTRNPNADYGQLHVQQDQTVNPDESSGINVTINENYHHGDHRYSITYGDPKSGGGLYTMRIDDNTETGGLSNLEARVKCIGNHDNLAFVIAADWNVDYSIDVSGSFPRADCRFSMTSFSPSNVTPPPVFTTIHPISGRLKTNSEAVINLPTGAANNLYIDRVDVGMVEAPNVTARIIDGNLLITSTFMRIDTEDLSATDELRTISFPGTVNPHGQVFYLIGTAAAREITCISTSAANPTNFNLGGQANNITLSNVNVTPFIWRGDQGVFLPIKQG